MWNSVLSGLFALGGVALGVLLEPFRAFIANRARIRQERMQACRQLVEAIQIASPWLVALNRFSRDESAGREIDAEKYNRAISEYTEARQQVRKAVAMLCLLGPDEVFERAKSLRNADHNLRKLRHESDDFASSADPDEPPEKIRRARDNIDEEIATFSKVARKYIV